MRCPFCSYEDSKVTDSRDAVEVNAIRRRRECSQCAKRFTTFETIDLSLQVRKRDGTFQDFNEEKLIAGMCSACVHTRVSHEDVCTLACKIKAELAERCMRQIDSKELGEIVMRKLMELDVIAYIRFVCVYKRFKDIKELLGAIQSISQTDAQQGDAICR